jgi:dTDP-4-dehydrorhamnose 3,5-epimerase
MKFEKCIIEDSYIIEPEVFGDQRGFFLETFNQNKYRSIVGKDINFVQDNHSFSTYGSLRGLHFQLNQPQGKLVRVSQGEVLDVVVDLRVESSSFLSWYSVILSAENKKQIWIPPGIAHGFLVLSDSADFEYKCSAFYSPEDEYTLLWNDKKIGIDWPIKDPVLSEKDSKGLSLDKVMKIIK